MIHRLGMPGRNCTVVARQLLDRQPIKDLNLKVGHAVLVVYLNSRIYLLDNQIKQVVEANSVYHYSPVYSINENNWWRHNPLTK